jgi:hypothetical protein
MMPCKVRAIEYLGVASNRLQYNHDHFNRPASQGAAACWPPHCWGWYNPGDLLDATLDPPGPDVQRWFRGGSWFIETNPDRG